MEIWIPACAGMTSQGMSLLALVGDCPVVLFVVTC